VKVAFILIGETSGELGRIEVDGLPAPEDDDDGALRDALVETLGSWPNLVPGDVIRIEALEL
jgi:hypothetical protein